MESVFVLQHVHALPNGNEDVKMIGVYSSRDTALAAIERLGKAPGFREFPAVVDPAAEVGEQGFYVSEYRLDEDHWTEGYITLAPEDC